MYALALIALIIINDLGGRVGDYLQRAHEPGQQIRGVCASACTMSLAAPGVCISPDALLVFHAATHPLGTLILWSEYPHPIQHWLARHGGLTTRPLTLRGSEAIRLGIQACH